ncbi:MAG: HD domain-containing protein [Bacteroidia bacterium]|nr:HD domain-containing protein [Bacteroidia bacterium]
MSLILKALDFAAVRHKTQFRKGEDKSPYINHPIQVASLLANKAGEKDTVLIAAAILHDVVEDTVDGKKEKNKLIEIIRETFGEEVLSVTLEVTDDKRLSKKMRKRMQVEHAPGLSVKARKLKIADKTMNVHDITVNPPVKWGLERIRKYLDWSEKVVYGLRGVNPKLEAIFDETLQIGRAKYSGRH